MAQADPLPSWNDTAPKKAIIAFVARVTREGGPDFVPVSARISTLDNDGTLWVEQPIYTQFMFAGNLLAWASNGFPSWLWIATPDAATVNSVTLTANAELYQPSAADLDGTAGEEIATGIGRGIHVFRTDESTYAVNGSDEGPNAVKFYYAQVIADDLDGNSQLETVALQQNLPGENQIARLHVWRKKRHRAQRDVSYPILLACSAIVSCGGGGGGSPTSPTLPPAGTPAGTYNITVSATSGTLTKTTTVTLQVN